MAFVSAVPVSSPLRAAPLLSAARAPPRTSSPPTARRSAARMTAAASPATSPTPAPERVVLTPLPRLLVYDHCPFCVRARHALGLKNVKHELVYLLNDDFATPTALIGKKMVPIFQAGGAAGAAVGESLDIVRLVDGDPRYGPPGLLRAASDRADLDALFDAIADPLRRLTRVRFAQMNLLPEFVFADARRTYVDRHPLPEPSDYADNFARSPEYIAAVQARMDDLAGMIFSPQCISEGGLSIDDIVYFPKLRSFTCIKGLVLPKAVRDYLEYHSAVAEIPLFDKLAL